MNQTAPFILLCWSLIVGATFWNTAYGNSCSDCHSRTDFRLQDQKIYRYYQDWTKSPHKTTGLTCDFCHGGDPAASDKDLAHQSILSVTNPLSKLYYRNLPDTCGSCHQDKLAQFKKSKHFAALSNERPAPSCTICHRPMHPRSRNSDIIQRSCQSCHYDQNPQDLPMLAVDTDKFLDRLSIAKIYLDWMTVFYQERNWPGNTRQMVEAIRTKSDEVVARVHGFDLEKTAETSTEILDEMKELFQQAWKEKWAIQ